MADPLEEPDHDPPRTAPPEEGARPEALLEELRDVSPRRRRGLGAWIERRAEETVRRMVSARVPDIEERAKRVVGHLYEERADDLEERAVRALRRAIQEESERIRAVVDQSVRVKKREVRLSLLVLVGAALVYLLLFWITGRSG